MPCLSPIPVQTGDGLSMVRCGRCRYCRIRRKQQWVGRLRLELMDHEAARFVTLTYRDDPGVLDVADLQGFFKRYRYYYGPCRFFAVGEYGENFGRGHWHAIIFGHAQQFKGHWLDNKAWTAGYSLDGSATVQSIGYVAGYTLKDSTSVRRPITRMSLKPGIGFSQLEDMGARLAAFHRSSPPASWPGGFSIGGRRYPLCDGGLVAVQRGYTNAGGLAPRTQTPDERHWLALDALGDLGTRIRGERLQRSHHYRNVGYDRLPPKTRETL